MKKIIIYFNGYNGRNSNKFRQIETYFKGFGIKVIQYDQTLDFLVDINNINSLLNKYKNYNIKFIGSSLGCIPAIYHSLDRGIDTVLINPSFFPEQTLGSLLKPTQLDSIIEYKKHICDYMNNDCFEFKKLNIYVSEDDERINKNLRDEFQLIFNNCINYYNKSKTGGHSYSILPEKLKSFYVSLYVNKEFDEKMEIDDYFQI